MKNGWLGLLVGLVTGGIITAGFGYYAVQNKLALQQQLAQQLRVLNVELQQSELKNQTLSTQLALDQATQDALELSLKQKQDEMGSLRDQLAFYDHLLPLSDSSSVQVRALDVNVQADDLISYKLLLQRPTGLERFNGHIQFTAHGQQDGKSVTMILDTAGLDPAQTIPIQFDQFLRTTGLLVLPSKETSNVIIDAVTLQIYQGKQLRATHNVDLSLK